MVEIRPVRITVSHGNVINETLKNPKNLIAESINFLYCLIRLTIFTHYTFRIKSEEQNIVFEIFSMNGKIQNLDYECTVFNIFMFRY